MSTLRQLWVAVAGTVVMFGYSLFVDDNGLSNLDWIKIANMGVGAVLVWLTTNGPVGSGAWQFAKTIASGLSAGLVLLLSAVGDGVSSGEWLQIGIAVLTALGVLVTPGVRLAPDALGRKAISSALG